MILPLAIGAPAGLRHFLSIQAEEIIQFLEAATRAAGWRTTDDIINRRGGGDHVDQVHFFRAMITKFDMHPK